MSNNSTTIHPLESPEPVARLSIYIISLILGTFGSTVVLIAIFSKKGSKTDYHLLLANLALADMTSIWYYVGVHFVLLSGYLRPGFCRAWPTLSVPLCASIFTITLMAMLRYRRIVWMWNHKMRKSTILFLVIGIWIASFVVFIPAIVVAKPAKRYCYLGWSTVLQKKIYTFALFALEYFFPLLFIMAAYVGIGCNLKRYEEQVERENIRQENRDIIKTLAIIVILFALFLMPLQIGFMMFEFGNIAMKKFTLSFMNYSDILCICHSCINPFVYGIVPREFRKHYSRWMRTLSRQFSKYSNENASYRVTTPANSLPLRNDSRYQLINVKVNSNKNGQCPQEQI